MLKLALNKSMCASDNEQGINKPWPNCRFFPKRFSVCFNLFVLLFLVTPSLAVAVQPNME